MEITQNPCPITVIVGHLTAVKQTLYYHCLLEQQRILVTCFDKSELFSKSMLLLSSHFVGFRSVSMQNAHSPNAVLRSVKIITAIICETPVFLMAYRKELFL